MLLRRCRHNMINHPRQDSVNTGPAEVKISQTYQWPTIYMYMSAAETGVHVVKPLMQLYNKYRINTAQIIVGDGLCLKHLRRNIKNKI